VILYNVTVGIDREVEEEWVVWMKEQHIPKVMATGMFFENRMFKVLTGEEDNISYSIQYFSEDLNKVENYLNNFAPALIAEHNERFRNKHVAFRTLLQSV